MAYNANGLVCIANFIGSVSDAPKKLYTYTTNDTKATVEGANYFDGGASIFNVGDGIDVFGDLDGTPYRAGYIVSSNDGSTVAVTYADLGVLATAAEINRACDLSTRIVNLTAATLDLTIADHDSKIVTVNRAAGSTLTLPAATGSGAKFDIVVGTTVTSNNLVIQVVGNDIMQGVATMLADGGDTVVGFETAADSDTITMNGSTKGGIKGDRIELIDIAADTWQVNIRGAGTSSEATMFSAAVA